MNLRTAGFIGGAYVMGSIPTGYWLGLAWKGIDIRKHGSGNVGATNVLRVLGPRAGVFTFTVDFLKGFVPVLAATHLFPGNLGLWLAIGCSAIAGHTTSVFVRFKGGKGVATAAGVFAALLPIPFLLGISLFGIVVGITRYVSLGSLCGSVMVALSAFAFSAPRPLAWAAAVVSLFVFWTHRTNIQRLMNGTENRILRDKKES